MGGEKHHYVFIWFYCVPFYTRHIQILNNELLLFSRMYFCSKWHKNKLSLHNHNYSFELYLYVKAYVNIMT